MVNYGLHSPNVKGYKWRGTQLSCAWSFNKIYRQLLGFARDFNKINKGTREFCVARLFCSGCGLDKSDSRFKVCLKNSFSLRGKAL